MDHMHHQLSKITCQKLLLSNWSYITSTSFKFLLKEISLFWFLFASLLWMKWYWIETGAKINLTEPMTLQHTLETTARKRNTFIMTADTAGKCKDAAFWVITTVYWDAIFPNHIWCWLLNQNPSPWEWAVWGSYLFSCLVNLTAQLQPLLCQNAFHPKPKS